ncbi:MAG: NAD(P)/FAD-dependent oxidoreductase [Myxococcota bacterium]|nr:NAD(P)/FAD-dependent oxidoreductase [Myxococcota bacterium]
MAEPINIVGAGLAGSLMALYQARRGQAVNLWDRRVDLRRADIPAGRSINLAISTRGLTALDRVDMRQTILDQAIRMPGRLIHAVDGSTSYQAYGQEGQAIHSISRRILNEHLLNAAEAAGAQTHFSEACKDVDLQTGAITFENEAGVHRQTSGLTIGADGIFSAVRGKMQRSARFNFDQLYISHGYSELTIPPAADGSFQMEAEALHIWPRHDFMLIALPNFDGSFTVTLFMRFDPDEAGNPCYAELKSAEDVIAFFEREFPDATPLIENLAEDFLGRPPSPLCTVRCSPYHKGEKVVLLGDAAHAVVPFYGQGMNAAFESARLLDELLATHAPDTGAALRAYSAQRVDDGHAIRQLALDHFADMSSSTADDVFLQARALEVHLENHLPDYKSLYGMVSFSNIPYAQAVAKAKRQGELLARMGELVQH